MRYANMLISNNLMENRYLVEGSGILFSEVSKKNISSNILKAAKHFLVDILCQSSWSLLKPDLRLDGTLETYQISINGAAIKIQT